MYGHPKELWKEPRPAGLGRARWERGHCGGEDGRRKMANIKEMC